MRPAADCDYPDKVTEPLFSKPAVPPGLPDLGGIAIDHLGIAVHSIARALEFYNVLGLHAGPVETVEHEQVRVAMLTVGESRIELLEPTCEDSTIGRFLVRRGEGMHHVALRVREIERYFDEISGAGLLLAGKGIGVGAGGHRYFFVHPVGTSGVLVELVEAT